MITHHTANKVVKKLIADQRTITTMESCTSGLLASMITDTEGASSIFFGGYVTYSNGAKVAAGVDAAVIEKYGVYSAECARTMAQTVQAAFKTNIAIGITGTTGNVDPNNGDSVQGEVYYCILMDGNMHDFHLKIDVSGKSRHEIKQIYADDVFERLAELLMC